MNKRVITLILTIISSLAAYFYSIEIEAPEPKPIHKNIDIQDKIRAILKEVERIEGSQPK